MTAGTDTPRVPVSWGELFDKISILEIKAERLEAPAALANVRRELELLKGVADEKVTDELRPMLADLRQVNEELWQIEDDIRDNEARSSFGEDFIALARSVYKKNDRRAAVKRQINGALLSELVEEKSYKTY